MEKLFCELCGRIEEVDGVTGVDIKGEKIFYFPNTSAGEMCVCRLCMDGEEEHDLAEGGE